MAEPKWVTCKEHHITNGRIVRLTNMEGAYNLATIIAVNDDEVSLARPMAYASDYNNRQPYLYCEVFSISKKRMCSQDTDIIVFDNASLLIT